MGTEPATGSEGPQESGDRPRMSSGSGGSSGGGLGHFFTTLPGLLTAGAGFVVAVTGLVTVLHQAGLIGGSRADPAPVIANSSAPQASGSGTPTPAPSPVSSPSPSSAPSAEPSPGPSPSPSDAGPARADLRLFEVGRVSDNFAWARRSPSADGETLVKLPTGTRLLCGPVVEDAALGSARFWRFCPQQGGYVAARLLQDAR